MKAILRVILFPIILLSYENWANAQIYSINWHKVSGGGTTTGGVYSASGTIGQPDASGAMSIGNYSLTGGFWSLISVVQTPGAPTLTITYSGGNVILSWPTNTTGFVLQSTLNLVPAASWSGVSPSPVVVNARNTVTNAITGAGKVYRLAQ
jgi:hypothetical protein